MASDAYDDERDTRAMVGDLWYPLFLGVLVRRRHSNAGENKEDVGLWVGKGPQSRVVFLSGRVKEAKCIGFVVDP